MSGTHTAYGVISYAFSGTDTPFPTRRPRTAISPRANAIPDTEPSSASLQCCSAMSGAETVYGRTGAWAKDARGDSALHHGALAAYAYAWY
eukprot:1641123-Rhodomonas_salina.5